MRRWSPGALAAGVLAAAAICGCTRIGGPCPSGTKLVPARSHPPLAFFCESEDGRAARWTERYPDGTTAKECFYVGGRAQGPFTSWHRNGRKWVEGRYDEGVKKGHWIQYDEKGLRAAEGDYRDGQFVGGAPVGIAGTCESQARAVKPGR